MNRRNQQGDKDKIPQSTLNTKPHRISCVCTARVWTAADTVFSVYCWLFFVLKTYSDILTESGSQHCHFNESDIQAAVINKCLSVSTLEGTRHSVFSPRPFLKFLWRSSGIKETASVSSGCYVDKSSWTTITLVMISTDYAGSWKEEILRLWFIFYNISLGKF